MRPRGPVLLAVLRPFSVFQPHSASWKILGQVKLKSYLPNGQVKKTESLLPCCMCSIKHVAIGSYKTLSDNTLANAKRSYSSRGDISDWKGLKGSTLPKNERTKTNWRFEWKSLIDFTLMRGFLSKVRNVSSLFSRLLKENQLYIFSSLIQKCLGRTQFLMSECVYLVVFLSWQSSQSRESCRVLQSPLCVSRTNSNRPSDTSRSPVILALTDCSLASPTVSPTPNNSCLCCNGQIFTISGSRTGNQSIMTPLAVRDLTSPWPLSEPIKSWMNLFVSDINNDWPVWLRRREINERRNSSRRGDFDDCSQDNTENRKSISLII